MCHLGFIHVSLTVSLCEEEDDDDKDEDNYGCSAGKQDSDTKQDALVTHEVPLLLTLSVFLQECKFSWGQRNPLVLAVHCAQTGPLRPASIPQAAAVVTAVAHAQRQVLETTATPTTFRSVKVKYFKRLFFPEIISHVMRNSLRIQFLTISVSVTEAVSL